MTSLYAAMRNDLLVAEDGTLSRRRPGSDFEYVAAHPAAPERAFVGTFDAGLHRSVDDGERVERVDDGRTWEALDGEWDEAFVSQTPQGLAVV